MCGWNPHSRSFQQATREIEAVFQGFSFGRGVARGWQARALGNVTRKGPAGRERKDRANSATEEAIGRVGF